MNSVSKNEKNAVDANAAELIKALIEQGRERGYIVVDKLRRLLPAEYQSEEKWEQLVNSFTELGISLVDSSDDVEDLTEEVAKVTSGVETTTDTVETVQTADAVGIKDPVRLYLKEMGAVDLLSREGEIAIAKRIAAGFNLMMNGLAECVPTYTLLAEWHHQLMDNELPLRDLIDLETAMEDLPKVENVAAPVVVEPEVADKKKTRVKDDVDEIDEDTDSEKEAEDEESGADAVSRRHIRNNAQGCNRPVRTMRLHRYVCGHLRRPADQSGAIGHQLRALRWP